MELVSWANARFAALRHRPRVLCGRCVVLAGGNSPFAVVVAVAVRYQQDRVVVTIREGPGDGNLSDIIRCS